MKKILALSAALGFIACGKLPENVSVSGTVEQTYCLSGDCSKEVTSVQDNKITGTETKPCDDPVVESAVASSSVETSAASPVAPVSTPVAAPVVVATPAPFVPHFTPMIHPLPIAYDPVFTLQSTVEFDINNDRIIDSANEQFVITFHKLADNSVVTLVAYGPSLNFFQEKYWYPNEFVNDMKPFANATQPWERWAYINGQWVNGVYVNAEKSNIVNSGSFDLNAEYSFQAWAPLGNTDFRARLYCRKQPIEHGRPNCAMDFTHLTDESLAYYSNSGVFNGQFSDGTYIHPGQFKGKMLNQSCLIGGSTGASVEDGCP